MKYFEQFEKIDINNEKFRDIFFRVISNSVIDKDLIDYTISDYETIKDLSYKFYGSVDLWWIIAILNNIYDLNFEWVLPQESLEDIAKEKATNESGTLNETDFLKYFDELSEENDKKRNIKLLQKTNVNKFITDFVSQLQTKANFDDYLKSAQKIISNINQRMIDDAIFDNSKCEIETKKVLNIISYPNVAYPVDIDVFWNLPSNNNEWDKIAIIHNNKAIDLIDKDKTSYTVDQKNNGKQIIDVVLMNKNEGVVVNTTVVPSIAGQDWHNLYSIPETLTRCCRDSDNNFYVGTNNGKIFRTDDFVNYDELTIPTNDVIVDIKATLSYIVAITAYETFVCKNGEDVFTNKSNLNNPFYSHMQTLIPTPDSNNLMFGSSISGRGYLRLADISQSIFIKSFDMQYISSYGWVSSGLIDSENMLLVQGGSNRISIESLNYNDYYTSIKYLQYANNKVAGQIVYNDYSKKYFAILTNMAYQQSNTLLKSDNGSNWSAVKTLDYPFNPVLAWCGEDGLVSGGINTIQRSIDGGLNWEEVHIVNGEVLEFATMNNGTIVAITNGTDNIYFSNAE